jgi:hypothetical protein
VGDCSIALNALAIVGVLSLKSLKICSEGGNRVNFLTRRLHYTFFTDYFFSSGVEILFYNILCC